MKPLGQIFIPGVMRVADLLTPNASIQNRDKVMEMFSPDDAADILQIAVRGAGVDDYLAWNYTKNGIFMVISAYHLKMSML